MRAGSPISQKFFKPGQYKRITSEEVKDKQELFTEIISSICQLWDDNNNRVNTKPIDIVTKAIGILNLISNLDYRTTLSAIGVADKNNLYLNELLELKRELEYIKEQKIEPAINDIQSIVDILTGLIKPLSNLFNKFEEKFFDYSYFRTSTNDNDTISSQDYDCHPQAKGFLSYMFNNTKYSNLLLHETNEPSVGLFNDKLYSNYRINYYIKLLNQYHGFLYIYYQNNKNIGLDNNSKFSLIAICLKLSEHVIRNNITISSIKTINNAFKENQFRALRNTLVHALDDDQQTKKLFQLLEGNDDNWPHNLVELLRGIVDASLMTMVNFNQSKHEKKYQTDKATDLLYKTEKLIDFFNENNINIHEIKNLTLEEALSNFDFIFNKFINFYEENKSQLEKEIFNKNELMLTKGSLELKFVTDMYVECLGESIAPLLGKNGKQGLLVEKNLDENDMIGNRLNAFSTLINEITNYRNGSTHLHIYDQLQNICMQTYALQFLVRDVIEEIINNERNDYPRVC